MNQTTTRQPILRNCTKCGQQYDALTGPYGHTVCERCFRLRTCRGCNKLFDPKEPGWHPDNRYCTAECFYSWRQKYWVIENIALEYKNTDLAHLPNPGASQAFMDWLSAPSGAKSEDDVVPARHAFIYGATGRGKTRTVLLALKREAWDVVPIYYRASMFAKELQDHLRPGGSGGFDDWIYEIQEAELLCLDECEKLKLDTAPRTESELFDLIEHRISYHYDTILISNGPPARFARRFGPDYRRALARRLNEFFTPFNFDLKPKPPAPDAPAA